MVGISTDEIWSHEVFASDAGLRFPLLADSHPKGAVARVYGAYLEREGLNCRALFVIDGEGIIRWVFGEPRPERADAVRNRRRILEAAGRIMDERGVEGLLMSDVAEAAGVGVGTLYRRFGDRGGLAYALLDERGREFQAAFLHGSPPLGPGAPPVERIRAFLHGWADELEEHAELMLMADTASPCARYQSGAYQANHAHVSALIRESHPEADSGYLAAALLAPLATDLYVHQRREQGMSIGRIKAGLDELLSCLDYE